MLSATVSAVSCVLMLEASFIGAFSSTTWNRYYPKPHSHYGFQNQKNHPHAMCSSSSTTTSLFYYKYHHLHTSTYNSSFSNNNKLSSGLCLRNNCEKNTANPFDSALFAISGGRGRGLEKIIEGATPLEGDMTLYMKAGPDGISVGDCPFAQYVRIILNEKKLPFTIRPCIPETKPAWLLDYYDGKMPALRHRSQCYTESDIIAEYLEFFFFDQDFSLKPTTSNEKKEYAQVKDIVGAVFPTIAKYLKHTNDGDEQDAVLKNNLCDELSKLEERLNSSDTSDTVTSNTEEGSITTTTRSGPFLSGNGEKMYLADCSLAPKLYHMQVGLKNFKKGALNLESDYPALSSYMQTMFERESFQESLYPEETMVWGWSIARGEI